METERKIFRALCNRQMRYRKLLEYSRQSHPANRPGYIMYIQTPNARWFRHLLHQHLSRAKLKRVQICNQNLVAQDTPCNLSSMHVFVRACLCLYLPIFSTCVCTRALATDESLTYHERRACYRPSSAACSHCAWHQQSCFGCVGIRMIRTTRDHV